MLGRVKVLVLKMTTGVSFEKVRLIGEEMQEAYKLNYLGWEGEE